jgi:serine/threonine protein kinase
LDEVAVSDVIRQALEACAHIHGRGVIHRDVKPENLLVRKNVVKLCDFGLSIVVPPDAVVRGVNGTAAFMPPEMVKQENYDFRVDVWAVGVTAYAMLFGQYPYSGQKRSSTEMKEAIRSNSRPPLFEPAKRVLANLEDNISGICKLPQASSTAVEFTKSLLSRNPEHRPTAAMALRLQYITRSSVENRKFPDLRETLRSAVDAGAFGRAAKQHMMTNLDEYLVYLRACPEAMESRSISIMKWCLEAAKEAKVMPCAVTPPTKDAVQECDTPSTPSEILEPWGSRSEASRELAATVVVNF